MTLGKDYPELGTETWSGFDTYDSHAEDISLVDAYHKGLLKLDPNLFPLLQPAPPEDDDDPELDDPVIV